MNITLYQVDAFARSVFTGNPAAICPLSEWLPDEVLQAIAQENNLSETAFFLHQGDYYHLRWFTPLFEVDLCGHATLASAHVLFQHLDYPEASILFKTRSGILTVERHDSTYWMDFPADSIQPATAPAEILSALGINPVATLKGKDDYLFILESEAQVRALTPDFLALAQAPCRGFIVSAPGSDVDFVSRCFYPRYGINEDPVTGSAHTTMAPYWAERLGRKELKARQISKRSGEVTCRMAGDRVVLGGTAITFLEGSVTI